MAVSRRRGGAKEITDYIEALNVELLSNYGKIDILWYDVSCPLTSAEAWDSVNRNYRLRKLQPDIIINDRSMLPRFRNAEGPFQRTTSGISSRA